MTKSKAFLSFLVAGKEQQLLSHCHIWTIFNKNTKTCICDRGTIEFVERERIQDIFIHISFFTLTKSKGRKLIIAEIYNKKC